MPHRLSRKWCRTASADPVLMLQQEGQRNVVSEVIGRSEAVSRFELLLRVRQRYRRLILGIVFRRFSLIGGVCCNESVTQVGQAEWPAFKPLASFSASSSWPAKCLMPTVVDHSKFGSLLHQRNRWLGEAMAIGTYVLPWLPENRRPSTGPCQGCR